MPNRVPAGGGDPPTPRASDNPGNDLRANAGEEAFGPQGRYPLLEIVPDPTIILDPDGLIVEVNGAAVAASGYAADELVGRAFEDFLPPEARAEVRADFDDVLDGATVDLETEIHRADGQLRSIAVRAAPIVEEGRRVGVIALLRDVTDDREVQAKLIRSEKLAALGELVSGVAHELNNPLAGIVNFAELLLMSSLPDEHREPVELIRAEAERAARIVRNLRTFGRGHRPERTLVFVNEILDRALAMRDYGLETQNIQIVKRYGHVPQVWADPIQLQQVFLNLILNAEQAMLSEPESAGTLTLASEATADTVRIIVGDTGPGVDPEIQDRIFDPFFSTRAPGSGTGLGLSISYGIVSEMGGRISVENDPDSGARFTVELPVEGSERVSGTGGADESREAGLRILIVDDEPSIRRSVTRLLERRGHNVEAAENGRAALEKLEGKSFDAIIADVRMPEMGGRELFETLKQNESPMAERIAFTTGDVVNERTAEFLRECGRPSMGKPFELDELERLVREVAAGSQRES